MRFTQSIQSFISNLENRVILYTLPVYVSLLLRRVLSALLTFRNQVAKTFISLNLGSQL